MGILDLAGLVKTTHRISEAFKDIHRSGRFPQIDSI
jgi:hypothetical protein